MTRRNGPKTTKRKPKLNAAKRGTPKLTVVQLAAERVGAKLKITATCDGRVVHWDTIDIDLAPQRDRFVRGVCKRLPGADAPVVEAELMKVPANLPSNGPASVGDPEELDLSRIVRPEQFHTPEVSGVAVPVVIGEDGKPAARWRQFLRWPDGRREVRELTTGLDLPGSGKLWVHPIPAGPPVIAAPSWSAAARQAWLRGAAAPDPADLFRRLCERVAYFLDLPPDTAAGTTATVVLWAILTYCYQTWSAVPYLYVGGPMGSGKTRLFEILARLVFRVLVSSNLTGPALFRTLHDRGGTLLFDEAERLRQATPDQQEILSMLLAGYKRGGQAIRLEPVGDSFRPLVFDVYGPKALACISGLPAPLASRCIPLTMFRAGPDSVKPARRIDADTATWQALRDDLHAQALEYGPAWSELAGRTDVCPKGINGRAFELWQPILAVAAWVESFGAVGLLELVQRYALAAVETNKDDAVPDADETLLEILAEFVRRGAKPTLAKSWPARRNMTPRPSTSGRRRP